ncbi:Ig-like domain-containing protein [Paenibacillus xylanilyticus]|uniref:Ig-like domain-containing protein n=1 Tax=Paenibacillus xylanilyticus TaxID=248903 RepID=UPI00138960ED|nr:Ig-like domain-containing protein [Paenibacillus xylanilyticus]
MNPSLAGTHINDIAYNPVTDRYVLAGQDKLYSFTGSGTPEVVYVDNTIPNFYRLTYGNGMFIATTQIEGQGSKIYRSTDGLVWTQVYTTNPGQAIFDIAYGNSTFVAVGEGGRAYVSNDGENWSVSTLPNYTSLASVTYNSGEFYTVSTNERVATSLNGVAWVEEWSDSSSAIDFADISIGGGRAVAVGYDSQTYDGHIKSAPAPQVNSVTVTPTNSSVVQGGTEQLTATVDVSGGAAQTVTWSSSDTNGNVKVDGNGLVSVAANATPGPYTITATSTVDGTKSGSATVTVTSAPAVNSVTVTPTNPSVVQGGTEQLTATVDVVGGASQSVTWSSSDTNGNVTVDANGLVSVAANATPGPYTITATSTVDGTKSGSATVTVTSAPAVNSVTVTPTNPSVVQGGTEQLTATVDVVGGASQSVTWSSSDTNGNVTVDANGLVSVAANATPGPYTITATSTVDGTKSGSATVTVTSAPAVNSVTVTPTNPSVVQGGAEQLTATVDVVGGASQSVTWSSSDTSGNVTVDANGLVSVAASATPGPYTITATSTVDGTKSGSATVTVTSAPAVNSVTVTPTNPSVVQGGTEQLTATVDVVGGAAQTVTWSSSDTNGNVTVDANGLVSVAANATPGPYTITATSTVDGTKSGSATVTVTSAPAVNSVTVTPTNPSVVQGDTEQLTATVDVVGGAAQTVTWSSSDTNGNVTVDANGLVSVAANATPGPYTITATSTVDGTKSGSATVTVTSAPAVNSVTVTPTNPSVVQGDTEQLTATVDVVGGAAQTVTWSSSDTNGNVTVDANGLVSVAANATPGPYTITATSTVDGTKSGSATVTVTSAPAVNSVTVTPTNSSVVQGGTEQLTATVDVVGGASQSVTWSSSDTNGNVTVDANGLVSVAANATPGPYTITATSTVDGTKSGSATINVVTQIKLYNVTINNLVDGTITATPINAPAGNVISLNILPDFGKRLKIGSLKYTYNSVDYPITGDVFIMPNGDVTISAEFEDISETIPFLSIVAPLFAPVTVGYEQPSAEKLIITNAGMVDTTIQSLTSSEPSTFVVEGSGENVAAGESIDTWTVRPVVGLPAGTYSSVITAVYGDGEIATTNLVLTVNPSSSSGGGGNSGNNGSGGGSQGGGTPSVDPPQPEPTGVPVIINGKSENIGKLETNVVENRSITTITPDPKKLLEWLAREGQNAIVTIPVNVSSDSIVGLLTGDVVKKMVDQSAVLELVTPLAIYRLPASQISIGTLADQLRADQSLSDMTIEVTISKAFPSETSIAKDSTNSNSALLLMDPVHFKLMAEFNGSRKEINRFNTYVERFITIPQTVDRNQITTGIVVGLDGSIHHVPTYVEQKDDRYYAVVNSLTNSLYTLVWHPVEFTDVTNHWAKSAINDMGSRMIATGVSEDIFEPNRDITRAEFAAMVIRALGLVPISGETPFIDVNKSDWFADYIYTAREYQLIEGYSNAQFAPMDTITREQAMTIIAKAMKITGIHPNLSPDQISMLLQEFKDESLISGYARDHIAAGLAMDILNGRTVTTIQPKNKITRAEVATLLQKLLKKSNLIQ